METLLGGLLGGILRFAPAVLKFFTQKADQAHELAMADKMASLEHQKKVDDLAQTTAENQVVLDKGGLEALLEAVKSQGQKSGVAWIDGLSQLMRPLITLQWVIFLYPGVTIVTFYLLLQSGMPVITALNQVFGVEEKAIVSGIINFWFLDRVIRKNRA